MPSGLKNYIRYVTGAAGGDDFLGTDRLNAAGSQLGSYLFSLEKDFTKCHIELRATHPFEDGSGMGFENVRDNLYTFYWRKNAPGTLLDEWVVEYLYTKNQSGAPSIEREDGVRVDHIRGGDNYFNNGVYSSGFSYKSQSMGTPLFGPLQFNEQGKVIGFSNNRVSAFHLGAKGTLSTTLSWKTMLTYTRNFGTYGTAFSPMRQQFYSLAQLSWKSPKHPLMLSALAGYDSGKLLPQNLGAGLQAQWNF
jgi:hypothetical protein